MSAGRRYLASVAYPGGRRLAGPPTSRRRVAFAWVERFLADPAAKPQVLFYPARTEARPQHGWTYDRRAARWRRSPGVPRS